MTEIENILWLKFKTYCGWNWKRIVAEIESILWLKFKEYCGWNWKHIVTEIENILWLKLKTFILAAKVCWNLYAVVNIYRKQAGVSSLVELSINPTSPITARLSVSQAKLMAVIYKTFLKVGNSIKYQMRTWNWWYFVAYILKRRIEENQVRLISFTQTFRFRCTWRAFRHNFGSALRMRRRKFLYIRSRVKWKL